MVIATYKASAACASDGTDTTASCHVSSSHGLEFSVGNNNGSSHHCRGLFQENISHTEMQPNWSLAGGQLYGRDKEQQELQAIFTRICPVVSTDAGSLSCDGNPDCKTKRELCLIIGESGSGKTTLANSLRPIVAKRGGIYVSGKFDQLESPDNCFSAVVQAMTALVDELLRRDDSATTVLKQDLCKVVSSEPMILALIPAMKRLCDTTFKELGENGFCQPPSLGSRSQASLIVGFRRIMKSIADHIFFIFFIDDMQWGDRVSLDLLAALVVDPDIRNLMVIGACRGNEMSAEDYLCITLRELEARHVTINNVLTGSLCVDVIQCMISDLLGWDDGDDGDDDSKEKSIELAKVVYQQTGGNAFFVVQYLKSLSEEGLVFQLTESKPNSTEYHNKRTKWDWVGKEALQNRIQCTNAISLLRDKVLRLDKEIQRILVTASCFGMDFQEPVLEKINQHERYVRSALAVAEEKGLIINSELHGSFRFAHDQIQKCFYDLIPSDQEKQSAHLSIGRQLWKLFDGDTSEHDLNLVTNQLTFGASLIADETERCDLATLLLRAGQIAAASSHFQTASAHLNMAISMLPFRHWRDLYSLSLDIFNATVEIECCTGNFTRVDELIDQILQNTRRKSHASLALTTKMYSLGSRNQLREAVELGFDILKDLGEHFPRRVSAARVLFELYRTKRWMNNFSDYDLLNLPLMMDEDKLTTMRIMSHLMMYTVMTIPKLYPIIMCRMMKLTVASGNSKFACMGTANYASLLCNLMGDIPGGMRFARLGLKLSAKFPAQEWIARVNTCSYAYCLTWTEPFRHTLGPLLAGHRAGLSSGDIEFATMSASIYALLSFESSTELAELEGSIEAFLTITQLYKQSTALSILQPIRMSVSVLRGSSTKIDDFGPGFDLMIKQARESNNISAVVVAHMSRLKLAVLFQRSGSGTLAVDLAKCNLDSIPHFYKVSISFYIAVYELLLCLGLCDNPKSQCRRNRRSSIRLTKKHLHLLQKSERYQTENCSNKVKLVKGMLSIAVSKMPHRLSGALGSLDLSIELAAKSSLWGEQGLACEVATNLLLGKLGGNDALPQAKVYLKRAVCAYQQWGATAKVKQLESLHSTLLVAS